MQIYYNSILAITHYQCKFNYVAKTYSYPYARVLVCSMLTWQVIYIVTSNIDIAQQPNLYEQHWHYTCRQIPESGGRGEVTHYHPFTTNRGLLRRAGN